MSNSAIMHELTELKARVDRLEGRTELLPNQRWRKAVGSVKANALTREAARLGAEWRAAENKRK